MPTLHRPSDLLGATPPAGSVKGSYYVQTWGCQMNEEDSEQMGLYLQGIGLTPAASLREASVVVLNTCSVRQKPEDKAFSLLGEVAEMKALRPDMIVGVAGCMAQARAEEIRRRAPHVDFVLGTGDLSALAGLVEEAAQKRRFRMRVELPERKGSTVTDIPQRHLGRAPKLKAFVPIQYGCDKFCTYCIVPQTRGRERSRPTEHVIEEVESLALRGTKEVTLLGQTVNSYGKNLLEGRVPFAKLLWRLAEIDGLERIRYTSPYPRDFKTDLVAAIRDCPKVMEHCHLPMQAGDDDLLREMKRVYTLDSYLEIVRSLREAVPHMGLTTDVIVGFPGETEAMFENTLRAMEAIRFDGAYMFAYSIRPGTVAGDRLDQIPASVKKARLSALIELQNRITVENNRLWHGCTVEVLVEGPSPKNPDVLQGYSREWRMVHFAGPAALAGGLAKVRVTGSAVWGLKGELAWNASSSMASVSSLRCRRSSPAAS